MHTFSGQVNVIVKTRVLSSLNPHISQGPPQYNNTVGSVGCDNNLTQQGDSTS